MRTSPLLYGVVNRLLQAAESSSVPSHAGCVGSANWGECYSYDGFGNLTNKTATQSPAPVLGVSYDINNHQLGLSYDANGNQMTDAQGATYYTWNVENRLATSTSHAWPGAETWYSYDPWGRRVMKDVNPDPQGQEEEPGYQNGAWEFYFYGITGQKLMTVGCSFSDGQPECGTSAYYKYFAGKLVQSGGMFNNGDAVLTDRLGSVRMVVTGYPPTQVSYFPYGEERTSTPDGTEKFGTYFRDGPGQDYAGQRYYGANTGSFWSPDPSMDSVDYSNPSTWNAYAYVNGDPVNANDPSGLGPVTLPPVVPGTNCSTAFINYAGELGMTIQQLFDSDAGILGVMSYFEQEGSGSSADQQVWAALDWTFLNRWNLSASDKAWFYGPNNIPSSFAASVTTGNTRSQVFTSSGQLTAGFTTDLLNILTGSPDSSQCEGLATAFDVAQGTINAENGNHIPGLLYITDPVPGALAFGSNGAVPSHSRYVVQTKIDTIADSPNTWNFYSDVYKPPPPVRRPPPRRPRRPGQLQ